MEKTDITVADFPSIDSAGLYIAEMEGLFAAQGLNVKIVEDFKGSQDTVDGIEKGTSDISSADYVTYLDNEIKYGKRLRIIAEASILQPNQLALLSSPKSKIKSLAQLKGKTLSVAAPGDIGTLLVDSLLADNDISSGDVNLKPGVPLPAAPQLLSKGAVAAAPVPEPFVSEGEETYGLQEVADLDQGGTANFPIQGFVVTEAWAAKYPNTLRAFVAALTEGQQIADTDRGAVEKATEKFLNVSPLTAAVMALPEFPLSVDPLRIQRVLSAMIQFHFLPAKDAKFDLTPMTG
ncbi:MAG TPA: ABC transporter substrate-binding protein [Trebonia sp.]|nr:ABC transporter substrate-binding protein [Trebonia sp.]